MSQLPSIGAGARENRWWFASLRVQDVALKDIYLRVRRFQRAAEKRQG
jgi:hypothetical protein